MSGKITSTIEWGNFNRNKVIIPICVRSPNARGRNFISMLNEIAKKVQTVDIVLCDYLDRYNLNNNGYLALQQSQEWQNKYLSEIKDRFSIDNLIHWKHIIAASSYKERHMQLCHLYKTNMHVKKAIDINVEIYVKSKIKRLTHDGNWDFDPQAIELNSRNYLLEEYAGTAAYKKALNCNHEVYWGVYLEDIDVFNRHSGSVDLRMPVTLPVNNSRIGKSIASIPAPSVAHKIAA